MSPEIAVAPTFWLPPPDPQPRPAAVSPNLDESGGESAECPTRPAGDGAMVLDAGPLRNPLGGGSLGLHRPDSSRPTPMTTGFTGAHPKLRCSPALGTRWGGRGGGGRGSRQPSG